MSYIFGPFSITRHGDWARDLLQMPPFALNTRGIVAEKDNVPVACMLATDWTETNCMAHIGIQDPMVFKHNMHREFAHYIYDTCGKMFMLGLIAADNAKALKLDKHFGFKEVYRIEDGCKVGVDYVLMRMDRADCRYYTESADKAQAA